MSRIFISYRRADSIAITGRIHDRLVETFGTENIFKDVDDIPPGADFRSVVAREVGACDVLLVVIGQQWSVITNPDGRHRLQDPTDFVRIEVESGLSRSDMLVIPVLTDYATMPSAKDLPDSLQPLLFRNAVGIRHDPDFNRDSTRLIQHLKHYFELQGEIKQDIHRLDNLPQSTSWLELETECSKIEEKTRDFETLLAKIHERREYWRAQYQEHAEQILTTARDLTQAQTPDTTSVMSLIEKARKVSPSKSVIESQAYLIVEKLRQIAEEQALEAQRKAEERAKAERVAEKPQPEPIAPLVMAAQERQSYSRAKDLPIFFPPVQIPEPISEGVLHGFLRKPARFVRPAAILLAGIAIVVFLSWFLSPAPSSRTPTPAPTSRPQTSVPTISPAIIAATEVARVTGSMKLVYGPTSGTAPEAEPNSCLGADTDPVDLKNFVLTVQIAWYDAPGNWARTIFFRDDGNGVAHFRLFLERTGSWGLVLWRGQYYNLTQGYVNKLVTSPGNITNVRFIVYNNDAWLYLNDNYVATLDVSNVVTSGGVHIASCLGGEYPRRDGTIHFSNFAVYSLDS